MANALGINLGEVYTQAEAIKGLRDERKEREDARERGKTVNALRQRVADDEPGAMDDLVAIAPEEATQTLEAIGKMSTQEREAAQERVDTMGRVSVSILQSQDPEAAYQQARQNLAPEIVASMPEQYDPNWVEMSLARTREVDDMLANPEMITFGGEDRLYQDGNVLESTTSSGALDRQNSRGNALIRAADEGGGSMKSSDTNAIYRQAAGLFGGIYDPTTGRIAGLGEAQAGKVQALTEEASRLYADGEASTHASAVAIAARKLGISVQNLGLPAGGGQTGGNPGALDVNTLVNQYAE